MSERADPSSAGKVVIDRLGAQGDGVAALAGAPVFIPFALPGETWLSPPPQGAVRPTHPIGNTSPDRIAAVCPNFGSCGGCVAQHMSPSLYASWKRGIVVEAFRQRGIAADIGPLRSIAARSRRRASLSAVRSENGIVFGYHARASHDICNIAQCPVLDPRIEAALGGLKSICGLLLLDNDKAGEARVAITLAKHGLDVSMTGAFRNIDARARFEIIQLAQQAHIQRLISNGEPVLAGAAPVVMISGVEVDLPDTAFLQAVPEAEAEILRLVIDGIARPPTKKSRIVDLFCGLGTYTFSLAKLAPVFALDSDTAAIAALTTAAKRLQGVKPIEPRRRDSPRANVRAPS